MAARATPNASAVVTMRHLEGDLSLLQRVVDFLPIEQLEKSHTVKAVSRAWRTAARRALTRGRWKPLRTLEGCRELICSDASYVDPEARRALKRAAQEAWALYPGEALLLILNWNHHVARDYLLLVNEPNKQGFGSIVAAFEKALQLGKTRTISSTRYGLSCREAVLYLLGQWMRQAMPSSFTIGPLDTMYLERERLAAPEWLGDELGRWEDPALAVTVVDVLIEYYHEDWHPRYDVLAGRMSANWADSGKRLRFMGLLAERQYQEDEDMMMRDQEAPHIVDDGMYNHL